MACGDDGDSGSGTATTSGAEASAFPVSIEHKYGTTEIETRPERIEPDSHLRWVGLEIIESTGGGMFDNEPWLRVP